MISKIIQSFDSDSQTLQLWQFRDVRFDIDSQFQYVQWEKIYGITYNIQDVRGNPGQRGVLIVTELRLIWYQTSNHEVNLSIGFDSLTKAQKKSSILTNGSSKFYLNLKASKGSSRYQFQFASLDQNTQSVYDQIIKFYKSSSLTTHYRKILLKNVSFKNNQIQLFALEKLVSKYPNVKYLFQKSIVNGFFFLTNVRVVWISQNINFSLPWICIKKIYKKEYNNSNFINFQVRDRLNSLDFLIIHANMNMIFVQSQRLFNSYKKKPTLGLVLENEKQIQKSQIKQFEQDVEIVQTNINLRRKNNYGNAQQNNKQVDIVYSEEMGLAIERLPQGVTIQNLWEVLR